MTRLVTQPEQPELIEDGPTTSQIRDMHNLASELKERALLILGLNFSDWLVRFFMRIAKQRRLSQREQERTEYLAEGRPELLPESMVLFFGTDQKYSDRPVRSEQVCRGPICGPEHRNQGAMPAALQSLSSNRAAVAR
jgi:hypothetical protein